MLKKWCGGGVNSRTLPGEALSYSTTYSNSRIPSSLAWVQHTQAGSWPNPHIGWPSGLWPLSKPIRTVCSLAFRWRLQLRVFFCWVQAASLIEGPDYTAPSCPTKLQYCSTIYPNSQSPSSLACAQCRQAGLRPNLHVGLWTFMMLLLDTKTFNWNRAFTKKCAHPSTPTPRPTTAPSRAGLPEERKRVEADGSAESTITASPSSLWPGGQSTPLSDRPFATKTARPHPPLVRLRPAVRSQGRSSLILMLIGGM